MSFTVAEYLKPTDIIDCEARSIKEKAQDLTRGQREITERAKSLFYFVRDEIKYNLYVPHYLPEHYRASATLSRGEGYCVQKAVLLAALARAIGMPTRLRFADIRNYLIPEKLEAERGTNIFFYHGYDEFYIEGRWVKAAPTFDLKICQKNRLIPVEFNGKNDAILHPRNQDGKLHIEYIHDHGYYQDVPLDDILSVQKRIFGSERGWQK